MHWFAVVLHALRGIFAARRDIPAQGIFDRIPADALWMLRNR